MEGSEDGDDVHHSLVSPLIYITESSLVAPSRTSAKDFYESYFGQLYKHFFYDKIPFSDEDGRGIQEVYDKTFLFMYVLISHICFNMVEIIGNEPEDLDKEGSVLIDFWRQLNYNFDSVLLEVVSDGVFKHRDVERVLQYSGLYRSEDAADKLFNVVDHYTDTPNVRYRTWGRINKAIKYTTTGGDQSFQEALSTSVFNLSNIQDLNFPEGMAGKILPSISLQSRENIMSSIYNQIIEGDPKKKEWVPICESVALIQFDEKFLEENESHDDYKTQRTQFLTGICKMVYISLFHFGCFVPNMQQIVQSTAPIESRYIEQISNISEDIKDIVAASIQNFRGTIGEDEEDETPSSETQSSEGSELIVVEVPEIKSFAENWRNYVVVALHYLSTVIFSQGYLSVVAWSEYLQNPNYASGSLDTTMSFRLNPDILYVTGFVAFESLKYIRQEDIVEQIQLELKSDLVEYTKEFDKLREPIGEIKKKELSALVKKAIFEFHDGEPEGEYTNYYTAQLSALRLASGSSEIRAPPVYERPPMETSSDVIDLSPPGGYLWLTDKNELETQEGELREVIDTYYMKSQLSGDLSEQKEKKQLFLPMPLIDTKSKNNDKGSAESRKRSFGMEVGPVEHSLLSLHKKRLNDNFPWPISEKSIEIKNQVNNLVLFHLKRYKPSKGDTEDVDPIDKKGVIDTVIICVKLYLKCISLLKGEQLRGWKASLNEIISVFNSNIIDSIFSLALYNKIYEPYKSTDPKIYDLQATTQTIGLNLDRKSLEDTLGVMHNARTTWRKYKKLVIESYKIIFATEVKATDQKEIEKRIKELYARATTTSFHVLLWQLIIQHAPKRFRSITALLSIIAIFQTGYVTSGAVANYIHSMDGAIQGLMSLEGTSPKKPMSAKYSVIPISALLSVMETTRDSPIHQKRFNNLMKFFTSLDLLSLSLPLRDTSRIEGHFEVYRLLKDTVRGFNGLRTSASSIFHTGVAREAFGMKGDNFDNWIFMQLENKAVVVRLFELLKIGKDIRGDITKDVTASPFVVGKYSTKIREFVKPSSAKPKTAGGTTPESGVSPASGPPPTPTPVIVPSAPVSGGGISNEQVKEVITALLLPINTLASLIAEESAKRGVMSVVESHLSPLKEKNIVKIAIAARMLTEMDYSVFKSVGTPSETQLEASKKNFRTKFEELFKDEIDVEEDAVTSSYMIGDSISLHLHQNGVEEVQLFESGEPLSVASLFAGRTRESKICSSISKRRVQDPTTKWRRKYQKERTRGAVVTFF